MPLTGNVYGIATLSAGTSGLTSLKSIVTNTSSLGVFPNPTPFTPYSEIVGQDLNGANIQAGLAKCEWHWAQLFIDDIEALLDYLTNDNTPTSVYIRTRIYDGTFANFAATMQLPTYDPPVLRLCKNVKVEFVALVAQ